MILLLPTGFFFTFFDNFKFKLAYGLLLTIKSKRVREIDRSALFNSVWGNLNNADVSISRT